MDSRKGNGPGECAYCGAPAGTLLNHAKHLNQKLKSMDEAGKPVTGHLRAHWERINHSLLPQHARTNGNVVHFI